MYRIGICDDGKSICSLVEGMILQYGTKNGMELEVEIWYSGECLCEYLKHGFSLDILFLDIELFKMTGIEVGSFIRNQMEDRVMQIIYISGNSSYALELFKTQPMDFMIKPITQKQVNEAMDLATKFVEKNAENFEFRVGKELYQVSFQEIMYFFSEGRKIKIVTHKGVHEYYGKLKDIIASLPVEFITIHQSYIVNKKYVKIYAYETVEMADGSKLTISKVNRKIIRRLFLEED